MLNMSNRTWVLVEWLDKKRQTSRYTPNYDIVHATALPCDPSDMTYQSVVSINLGNGKVRSAKFLFSSDDKQSLEKDIDIMKMCDRQIKKAENACRRFVNKVKSRSRLQTPETSKSERQTQICQQDTQAELTPSVTSKLFEEFDKMMNLGEDAINTVKSNASDNKPELLTGHNDNRPTRSDPLPETISNVTRTKAQDNVVMVVDKYKDTAGPSGIQDREAQVVKNVKPNQTTDSDMVPIGHGNARVPARLLDSMNWNSYMTATRLLVEAVFPGSVLATHCLTEKPATRNKAAKKRLDPKLVDDIVDIVSTKCSVSKFLVRDAIVSKCKFEENQHNRRQRKRKEKKKDANTPKRRHSSNPEES